MMHGGIDLAQPQRLRTIVGARLTWISDQVGTSDYVADMERCEFQPGDLAPATGEYEQLNVFGTSTGWVELMQEGEPFPKAPRGFSWRPLSERSAEELRAQAAENRRMAETARTETARSGLLKLAARLEALAEKRESDQRATRREPD